MVNFNFFQSSSFCCNRHSWPSSPSVLEDCGQNKWTSKSFQSPSCMLMPFGFSFINLLYILYISVQWLAICLKFWTWISYFSSSAGLSVTNAWISRSVAIDPSLLGSIISSHLDYVVILPDWTLIFWVGYGKVCRQEWTPQRHVEQQHSTMYSKHYRNTRFDNTSGRVSLCDHFKSERIFTLTSYNLYTSPPISKLSNDYCHHSLSSC